MPVSPRTIDLYGRALDGQLMLWKHAMEVVPVTAFERSGRWIRSGYYVISRDGDVVVAHCANADGGRVSVQFMQEERTLHIFSREMVESMLLGKMAVSEEQRAAIFEGKRLSDFFASG